MGGFDAINVLAADGTQEKIASQKSAAKLREAIYDVKQQYGEFLNQAQDMQGFKDRLAMVKNDMMKTVDAHLMPVSGVMNKVTASLRDDFKKKTAGQPWDEEKARNQSVEDFHQETKDRGFWEDLDNPDSNAEFPPRATDRGPWLEDGTSAQQARSMGGRDFPHLKTQSSSANNISDPDGSRRRQNLRDMGYSDHPDLVGYEHEGLDPNESRAMGGRDYPHMKKIQNRKTACEVVWQENPGEDPQHRIAWPEEDVELTVGPNGEDVWAWECKDGGTVKGSGECLTPDQAAQAAEDCYNIEIVEIQKQGGWLPPDDPEGPQKQSATDRDRYRDMSYSAPRDRRREEHGRQDLSESDTHTVDEYKQNYPWRDEAPSWMQDSDYPPNYQGEDFSDPEARFWNSQGEPPMGKITSPDNRLYGQHVTADEDYASAWEEATTHETEEKRAYNRRADFNGEVVNEGDFPGYLDAVDQNAPEAVSQNFDPGEEVESNFSNETPDPNFVKGNRLGTAWGGADGSQTVDTIGGNQGFGDLGGLGSGVSDFGGFGDQSFDMNQTPNTIGTGQTPDAGASMYNTFQEQQNPGGLDFGNAGNTFTSSRAPMPIQLYADWCDSNGYEKISVRTLEAYRENTDPVGYKMIEAAVKQAWSPAEEQALSDWKTRTHDPDSGEYLNPNERNTNTWTGPQRERSNASGDNPMFDYWDSLERPADPRDHVEQPPEYWDSVRESSLKNFFTREAVQDERALLEKADQALTDLLNNRAETFQETLSPIQDALRSVQYAEAVEQAANPMNVMPPAGTVDVMPQAPQLEPPMPGSVDPLALGQDPMTQNDPLMQGLQMQQGK